MCAFSLETKEVGVRNDGEDDRDISSPFVRLPTKEHQVAEFLRESIFAGVFARGQKLKQAEIAKRLDISITPVREALKLLEAEGYILISAHRGAVVAPFEIERVDELYQLRLAMETKLTLEAAKLLTAEDVRELAALNDMIRQAAHHKMRETVRGSNFRFHFRLYEKADMPQTLHFVRVVWAKYPFDMIGSIPQRPEQVVDEHTKIIEALEARDPRRAMRAMQAHIESGQRLFKANYGIGAGR
jgi:DNA-binding GntR family transcriptional regulator